MDHHSREHRGLVCAQIEDYTDAELAWLNLDSQWDCHTKSVLGHKSQEHFKCICESPQRIFLTLQHHKAEMQNFDARELI